jgi:hypothetical protein
VAKKMGDAKEAKSLKRRIAMCEALKILVETKNYSGIDATELHGYYELLLESQILNSSRDDLTPNKIQVELKCLAAHYTRELNKTVGDTWGAESAKAIEQFADVHLPQVPDSVEGFDIFKPSVAAILVETLKEDEVRRAANSNKDDLNELLMLAEWEAGRASLVVDNV